MLFQELRKGGIKMNYDKVCTEILEKIKTEEKKPTLLLQACCAPCSSAVLERLASFFSISMFFYNPNITEEREYEKRKEELQKFLSLKYPMITLLNCPYEKEAFLLKTKGLEKEKEGGKRCYACYSLRLEKAALVAKEHHFDYFGTTLSISPYKNSKWLNEIGEELAKKYQVNYLYADFKKKNGYKRSIELSHLYYLYRQDYCGCVYSKIEREQKKREESLAH